MSFLQKPRPQRVISLIGRDGAVSKIVGTFSMEEPGGNLLVFVGEDGMGKSSVLGRAKAMARDRSWSVSSSTCNGFTSTFDVISVITEATKSLRRDTSPVVSRVEAFGKTAGPNLANRGYRVGADGFEVSASVDRATSPATILPAGVALTNLLRDVSSAALDKHRGVMLAYDNIQDFKADPQGLQALRSLVDAVSLVQAEGYPLTLILTADRGGIERLRDAFDGHPIGMATYHTLRPFSELSVGQWMSKAGVGRIMDVGALMDETEGHPKLLGAWIGRLRTYKHCFGENGSVVHAQDGARLPTLVRIIKEEVVDSVGGEENYMRFREAAFGSIVTRGPARLTVVKDDEGGIAS